MFRTTAFLAALAMTGPFLPFECLCCDAHGLAVTDCGPFGVHARHGAHEADHSADVVMALNRTPSNDDAPGDDCFCGTGAAHALSRLGWTSPLLLTSQVVVGVPEFGSRRIPSHGDVLPPSPDLWPESPPPLTAVL